MSNNFEHKDETLYKIPYYAVMREDIVISGISGMFPKSADMNQFAENLYNGVNCVDGTKRYLSGYDGMPLYIGNIPTDFDRFDSKFFGLDHNEVEQMSYDTRVLCEKIYEAIVDSGTDPREIKGKNIGCYFTQNERRITVDGHLPPHMWIKHIFDIRGPCVLSEAFCASSIHCLNDAFFAIRTGECDAAIVAASEVCFDPAEWISTSKLDVNSPESKCKPFDESCDGYANGEAIVAFFLQRKSCARRSYLTIKGIKNNNDGYKLEGNLFPKWQMQSKLISETFEEFGLNPLDVEYIEAHVTGTKVGDIQECKAIGEALYKKVKRTRPLLAGALKGNIGHTLNASGACALAKTIILSENKLIPANINLTKLNPKIPELFDGTIQPILNETSFEGGLIVLNNFGIGGSNSHLIIESKKNGFMKFNKNKQNLPRLVVLCGRTKEAVEYMFSFIENNPSKVTDDFLSLLYKISLQNNMRYRGTMILNNSNVERDDSIIIEKLNSVPPELCFIFPGIGSQCLAIGKSFMQIECFAQSVFEISSILKAYNIDIIELLTSDNALIKNQRNATLSILAFQIAMIDLMVKLGLKGDKYIGNSTGQLACAYAAGMLNKLEALSICYWFSYYSEKYYGNKYSIALIKSSLDKIDKFLSKGLEVCSHFGDKITLVTGLKYEILSLMTTFSNMDIEVIEIESCGLISNGKLLKQMLSPLKTELNMLEISSSKKSNKWISCNDCKLSSSNVGFYIENITSFFDYNKITQTISNDAFIIEIAPQSLFKLAFIDNPSSNNEYIDLNETKEIKGFLNKIGKLYRIGLNPIIENLYPKFEFPVSKGTPFISPLIKWNHSKQWEFQEIEINQIKERKAHITITQDDDKYSSFYDHIVEDNCVFPGTGYLLLVWESLAKFFKTDINHFPIEFTNVKIKSMKIISKDMEIKFVIQFSKDYNEFTVKDAQNIYATGCVSKLNHPLKNGWIKQEILDKSVGENNMLDSIGFYRKLRLHGYDYGPRFCGAQFVAYDGSHSKVKWTGDWASFLDSCLQLGVMRVSGDKLALPVSFDMIRIDPRQMTKLLKVDEHPIIDFVFDKCTNLYICDCFEATDLNVTLVQRKAQQNLVLEKHIFMAYEDKCSFDETNMNNIMRYLNACNNLVKNKHKLNSEEINEFIEDESEDYMAIKKMHNCPIDDIDNIKNAFDKFDINGKYILHTDAMLTRWLNMDNVLKPCVNLVIENVKNNNLDVHEILYGGMSLEYKISEIFNLKGKKFSYSSVEKILNVKSNANKVVADKSSDLIIYHDQSSSKFGDCYSNINQDISTVITDITDNGFLLVIIRVNNFEFEENILQKKLQSYQENYEKLMKQANSFGLSLICERYDSLSMKLILFRKIVKQTCYNKNNIVVIKNESLEWFDELQNYYSKMQSGDKIWLFADEKKSGILGFFNCLKKEPYGEQLRLIFTDEQKDYNEIKRLVEDLSIMDFQENIYRNGKWGQMVHLSIENYLDGWSATQFASVRTKTIGELNSISWFNNSNKFWSLNRKHEKDILIDVYYSAMNFKDIMIASGQLDDPNFEDCLCSEFSGIDQNGNRLMGIKYGTLATNVVLRHDEENMFYCRVPDTMSLKEAATIPVAYLTSYYALLVKGKLRMNETVLIHLGSGGVGYSAIRICLDMKCNIFTTVGSNEKKMFLLEEFPELNENQILNSRSTRFELEVVKATCGNGVDLVLNALSGDKLIASARCLAKNGRFCDISRFDMAVNNEFDLSLIGNNQVYHSIMLEPGKKILAHLLKDGLERGVVKPIPFIIFEREKIIDAFRFMASGKHKGKVLVEVRNENTQLYKPLNVKGQFRTYFNPCKSYIVTGGLGGFGLEIIKWIAQRGAKNIIITSRTGKTDNYQNYVLEHLRSLGITIKIWSGHSFEEDQVFDIIITAEKFAPVGGIFHLAMVLKDTPFVNMSKEDFDLVYTTKCKILQHFDKLTRVMCTNLEYFVVFSTYSSGKGNMAQTNYGFGNSVCERICEERRKHGLPAIAIQWGAIGDVGVYAEKLKNKRSLGITIQRIPSSLDIFDKFLNAGHCIVSSYVQKIDTQVYKNDLITQLSRMMGIKNLAKQDGKTQLVELGLDSLLTIELKFILERNFNINLSPKKIPRLTINELNEIQSGTMAVDQARIIEETGLDIEDIKFIPMTKLTTETFTVVNKSNNSKKIVFLPTGTGDNDFLSDVFELLQFTYLIVNLTETFIIQASTEKYVQTIISEIQQSEYAPESYNLCGTSYGANLAFEMALQLQAMGKQVDNLVLLDGAPGFFEDIWRQSANIEADDKKFIPFNVIRVISNLTRGENALDIIDQISVSESEDEIFELAYKYLKANGVTVDKDIVINRIKLYLTVVTSTGAYKPASKFDGNVILVKPSINKFIAHIKHEEDYNLSKIITGDVKIVTVEGDHYDMYQKSSKEIAKIFNNF